MNSKNDDFAKAIRHQVERIRDSTIICTDTACLHLPAVEKGILIIFASWSGQAVINLRKALILIYDRKYSGQIIILNHDSMTPECQLETLGQLCHGWGEIFIIEKGTIVKSYSGKSCFDSFLQAFSVTNQS